MEIFTIIIYLNRYTTGFHIILEIIRIIIIASAVYVVDS